MTTYYTTLTDTGAAADTNARVAGTSVHLTNLAVGDGNGAFVIPTESMTALVHERHRGPVSSLTVDVSNPSWLVAEAVIPAAVGGFTVREIGLYDDAGHLYAVGNFPETYKPMLAEGSARDLLIRMIIETSNAANVTLTIDPAVVVATNQSVANAINGHQIAPDPHPQYLSQAEGDGRYLQGVSSASDAAPGVVELATIGETATGTDAQRAVTPAGAAATFATIKTVQTLQIPQSVVSLGLLRSQLNNGGF